MRLETLDEAILQYQEEIIIEEVDSYQIDIDVTYYVDGYITASGTIPEEGRTIAMDISFPFGTIVYINGNKYICEDRGGDIVGNRVDIYINSRQEAFTLGRKQMTATIIRGN